MRSVIRARFTDIDDGDLGRGADPEMVTARRAAIHEAEWTWLDQQHGAEVLTVTHAGEHAGARADAAVTTAVNAPLAVHTADCAPLLLTGDGAVGVVHAGWRGLVAGVVEATIERMDELDGRPFGARLGPCIRPECYEFGRSDLAPIVARYGPVAASVTDAGEPALDLAAVIRVVCRRAGIALEDDRICTSCSSRHWSHRARGDRGRQALVAWLEPEPPADVSVPRSDHR